MVTPTIQRLNRSAVLLAAVLALSGCITPAPDAVDSGPLQAQWVDLPDGRVVVCVSANPDQWPASGLDCDWANAALEGEL